MVSIHSSALIVDWNYLTFAMIPGVITSMCVDPSQSWLATGTDNGVHICWDLRFRLPVATVVHPAGSRILRLSSHPTQPSCLISAVHHNNEVSIWDWENQSRTMALWASSVPPLSTTQVNRNHFGWYILFAIGSLPTIFFFHFCCKKKNEIASINN